MYQRRARASIQIAGSSNQTSIKAPTRSVTIAINHLDQNKGSIMADPTLSL